MTATIPLVAPVRLSGGGLSMQTTTSRIGSRGLFVRSLLSPKEGAQMALVLSLPGSARPLQVSGTVGPRPAETAKDAGFWVGFDELSDDAYAFLDVLLRSRGVEGIRRPLARPAPVAARPAPKPSEPPVQRPPSPDDSRAWPRVPARLRVGWTSSEDFLSAYSKNISRGGIFIATESPPALREVVELSVELPDGGPPVKTRAEVVHRVTAEEARESGGVAGAGLQFLDASHDFQERLDACIEALKD
jgi:uncharacterized protein (TIGR02266 family)